MTVHQRFTDSFLILKLFESLTRSEICFFLSVVSFSPSSAMISWLQMMQSNLNLLDNYFTSGKILGICPEVASVLPCRHERFRILFKSCDATKKTKEWAQRTSEWNKWIMLLSKRTQEAFWNGRKVSKNLSLNLGFLSYKDCEMLFTEFTKSES